MINYRKWVDHLIERFGLRIQRWAVNFMGCPCIYFNWDCKYCKYSDIEKYPLDHWCEEAKDFYHSFYGHQKRLKKLKRKILKRLN